MPIYMDRHDVSDTVTAENVAQLHQEDLKIQDKFGCRGLTYWFDDQRKTAFCLIEAPNASTVQKMHDYAHGEVSHHIIEVDPQVVESFLGRIEDPKKSHDDELTIINDSAFRVLMVINLKRKSIKKKDAEKYYSALAEYKNSLNSLIVNQDGRIVRNSADGLLISFRSVSQAISSALALSKCVEAFSDSIIQSIGISAGAPVTDNTALFSATIKSAERICHTTHTHITVTAEVKKLYKSENNNAFIDNDLALALSPTDEQFIEDLVDYISQVWSNTDLRVDDVAKKIGYSKSQFYRKMIELTGKSPLAFLKEYRLERALELLENQNHHVSEIAYMTGFNSASYFSKCFHGRYDILPSELIDN
jgi:AraC-like DNA-binding protein